MKGVAFRPDGRLVAGAYSDGTIRLRNPATSEVTLSFLQTGPGARKSADGVVFSPDQSLLASGYRDGTLRSRNMGTGQHGGLASADWLVTTKSVIAIVLSALPRP